MKSKAMKITAIASAVLFATILALPYLVNIDRFRPQIESSLKTTLGREVHLGHMELSLLAGGARVEKIAIDDDPAFSKGTFAEAKSVNVGVSLLSLIFTHSVHVTSLTIEEPKIAAIKSAKGKWNFATLGNAGSGEAETTEASMESQSSSVTLDRVKISNATVELVSRQHQTTTLKNIDVDLKNVSLDSAVTFTLSAAAGEGKLKIDGEAGPIRHDDSADPASAVVHMKVKGERVPLDSVEVFLPALGIVLPGGSTLHGGTVNASLALDGPMNHLVTSGSVEVAKAHLKGFDLASKLGDTIAKAGSDLVIANLSTHLRVAPDGTQITSFNGQFAGIGNITGGGDVNASNHLQFKMVAHVPSDGVLRFGMNHVGLKNVPNDMPFQVVGTTVAPIVIPEWSGMAKNSAKTAATAAASSAAKSMMQKPGTTGVQSASSQSASAQSASQKKGGFFHSLFHHKEKQGNAASSTQLASQNTKY